MSDKTKICFEQPPPGSEGAPPYSFYVERIFDAVKQVGAANSAGVFGGLVAIYYFGAKSAEIMNFLKLTTAVYFGGVFLFAFSYSSFATFFIYQVPSLSGSAKFKPSSWRYVSGLAFGVLSFVAWLFGSTLAAVVLFRL
ncbi:hypothetical protein [Bradyrhizobium sp. CCBAU 11430]|uniref:hypothetical protein n=1 Tax=Bradyrhizobium sp. CCBAU 11430 TaxID=1630881 RepID=UPI002305409B|nr:hypothetical protein [Bradyrhizobium sp. CCBAU 11430]